MNLFTILRNQYATQPNVIASRSSRRIVTYRKFWSRIERATARLKSEWHIKPGDTVVYWGQGHQDALMLYIAVARCGAKLLPLEHTSLREESVTLLKNMQVALLLHDDEIIFDVEPAATVVTNLSSLIAVRCHHIPTVSEDITLPSLMSLGAEKDSGLQVREQNLQQLMQSAEPYIASHPEQEFRIAEALFDADIFASRVLPILASGGTIIFR